jgi:hypothetical protein
MDMAAHYEEEEDELPTLEVLCRKHSYEFIKADRAYCSMYMDYCQYRAEEKDQHGYRCMLLEKQI